MATIRPLDSLKTTRDCALKLLEESSEACEALKKYAKVHGQRARLDALLELADVAQCLTNCLQSLNALSTEWDEAVAAVREHNEERDRHEREGTKSLTADWTYHA